LQRSSAPEKQESLGYRVALTATYEKQTDTMTAHTMPVWHSAVKMKTTSVNENRIRTQITETE